jgi:hypothetical protein
METNVIADAGLVTVSFIIDTQYILHNFPDAELNRKSPVRIDAGVLSMLCDMKSVVSGYNTRNMTIKASIGDVVVLTAEPKDYIANECIQLYTIVPWIGRLNVQPHKSETGKDTETDCRKPEVNNFMAMVKRKGQEQLELRFSVYTLSNGTYSLHGHFYCDLLGLEVV